MKNDNASLLSDPANNARAPPCIFNAYIKEAIFRKSNDRGELGTTHAANMRARKREREREKERDETMRALCVSADTRHRTRPWDAPVLMNRSPHVARGVRVSYHSESRSFSRPCVATNDSRVPR